MHTAGNAAGASEGSTTLEDDEGARSNGARAASGTAGQRATRGRRVAYIVRSFPRLSQTHILNEILALERLGHSINIFGMTASGETLVQDGVAQVRGRPEFLDRALTLPPLAVARHHLEVLRRHPVRYAMTALYLARRSDLTAGYTTTSRYACFKQAVHLAATLQRAGRESGEGFDHIHSHFAHDPTLIALLSKRLTGISYSFTAHARDMYQIPRSSLVERIKQASAVVTICQANVDFLRQVARQEGHDPDVRLIHTGIDIEAFRPPEEKPRAPEKPLILVVSRLVEKKGLLDLLRALARVKAHGRAFRCVIYGDGPQRADLEELIAQLSLEGDVELAGPSTQAKLRHILREGDLFALTPFVTVDGDREGLPSSVLEAMACGLPVVSTAVAGVPEAVVHGTTGLLAEPHDVEGIAAHIETLLDDEDLRARYGANARAAIVQRWGAETVARQLANVFAGNSRSEP